MKFLSNSSILALSAAATLLGVATFTPAIPAQLLLAPSLDSAPAASVQLAANTGKYKDGSYKGPAYDAYYGLVQVVAEADDFHGFFFLENNVLAAISRNFNPLCPKHRGRGLGTAGGEENQGDKVFHGFSLTAQG